MRLFVIVLAVLVAWVAPAAAQRVVFEAEAGLERQRAELERHVESDLERIERDLEGLPRAERVVVRLVKHSADLAKVAPPGRGAPEWAIGVMWPGTDVVAVAARDRRGQLIDMRQTLRHELAHLALDRAIGGEARVPRWLTEGFAWQHSADAGWERGWTLFGATMRGDVVRLADLEDRFPADERAVGLAYAESYDFVAFLARRGRWADKDDDGNRGAFQQMLAELSAGKGLNEAMVAAYGRTFPQLEQEWLDSLRERFLWLPASVLFGFVWGLGGVLLVLAWMRRKRLARAKMKQWDLEDALAESQRAAEKGLMN